jgi:hypothetical protein
MSEQHKVDSKLLDEISKGKELHHVKTHVEDTFLTTAKLQMEITKGKELHHVDAPKVGLSTDIKQAFLEDQNEKK